MPTIRQRSKISLWHRRLGLILSLPLLLWIVSAFALHYYGLVMPNGLQGIYQLSPYNSSKLDLASAKISPTEILNKLRNEHGIRQIYWLKLQAVGPHLWYTVKPTPYSTGMVFDARTGQRLDPLSDDLLLAVANEALTGTRAVRLEPTRQYHRDYTTKLLPAVKVTMAGEQPTELILSRDTGRTLRRSDSQAQGFNWWYKTLHVFQWGQNMLYFTLFLYVVAALVAVLAVFGLSLWWWRRARPKTAYQKTGMKVRALHRKLGLVIGTLLFFQMFLGAYMWLSLGPLQDPFRGKNTFNLAGPQVGFATSDTLASPGEVLARAKMITNDHPAPVQEIQWRTLNSQPVWLIKTRKDEVGEMFDAATGQPVGELSPESAGRFAQQFMQGLPSFDYVGETTYYYNDLNRKIPAYHFRFADGSATDVFISKTTGDILSRRTRFWRAFSPILMLHAYAFTGNKIIDTIVLTLFQVSLLGLMITGWMMNFARKSNQVQAGEGI